MSSRWPRYGAALAGLCWFLWLGGWPALNPVNIGWVLSGDWRQHWLGWLYFRGEPWTFPIGTITSLPYPIGTTIGFTDSNPLVSILLKPFSGYLPSEFQFIGPWLALCFVMQGYMGAALAETVTRNGLQQFLGGSLFAMSPVLAARVGHDTLCAQWVLLGLLSLGLRECADGREAERDARWAAAGPMLAAAIHPYLAAMAWILAQAAFGRWWRAGLITPWRAAAMAVLTTAGTFAVLGAIGYFGDAGMGSPGFGVYSADLLAFFDPREYSRALSGLRLPSDQWEGFGYLGLGGLLAGACAVLAVVRSGPSLRAGAGMVIGACGLMFIYALSVKVTLDGEQIARLHTLYDPFAFFTNTFRASGRFIWPVHGLALLAGIWGATHLAGSRRAVGAALLAVAVMLQAWDFKMDPEMFADKHFRQTPISDFALAAGHYHHMAIYPTQILAACGDEYQEDHVYRFMLEAYRLKLTFNSGIFARLPLARAQEACGDLYRTVENSTLDPATIYVVSKDAVASMKAAGATCNRFDGDWVCVSRESDPTFRTYLESGKRQ